MYSLVLAGLLVATSSLSDRFGRKRTLLAGFFLFGVTAGSIRQQPRIRHRHPRVSRRGGALIMPVTVSMIRSIFKMRRARVRRGVVGHRSARHGHRPLIGGFLLEHLVACGFPRQRAVMAIALGAGIFVLPEVRLKSRARSTSSPPHLPRRHGAVPVGIKHLAAELAFDTQVAAVAAGVVLSACSSTGACTPRRRSSTCRSSAASLHGGHHRHRGLHVRHGDPALHAFQWLQLVNGDGTLEAGVKLVPMAIAVSRERRGHAARHAAAA
ncbi:MAG: hypothetical protein ACLTMP_08275 [Eggerthella lenta]